MKDSLFYGFVIAIIVLSFSIVIANNSQASVVTGNVVNTGASGEVQRVILRVDGGQYVLEPSTLTAGKPVRIEADLSSVRGCAASVRIPAFNVAYTFNGRSNALEFTPDKAGTFNIACSMNMYKGTFTVLNADGSGSSYQEAAPAGGMACGGAGGSGGCGCGG